MHQLKIGWSEVSITPDKKMALNGQFAERISEYVEKPLYITAMAVDTGEDHMVLCSLDLVNLGFNLVEAVRERLDVPGLDPKKVILAAIHTHTGPNPTSLRYISRKVGKPIDARTMLKNRLPQGKRYVEKVTVTESPDIITPKEYFALLTDRVVTAVTQAWERREPGSVTNAFGRAAVGMCRRVVYTDGSAKMWGDSNTPTFERVEGGSDTGIELMYVFGPEKQLKGIVANLACPAQCVQHRLFVSPDFWGDVKVRLRQAFGEELFLVTLCSAAGDQCPVDLVRWVEPESDIHDPNCEHIDPPRRKADPSMFDLSGMKKVGRRIAQEIIATYEEGLDEPWEDPEIVHTVNTWKLPLRRVTPAEIGEAQETVDRYLQNTPGDVDYNDAARLQKYLGILGRGQVQEELDLVEIESHVVKFGPVAIATNPFELFLDYGNQIKARSRAEQTFILQLTNGAEGYLPTRLAEQGGHYSAFVSSGQVGHAGGELLVNLTLDKIRELF